MDELSVAQVAALRSWIRTGLDAGHPMSVIDAKLRETYPKITAAQVLKMSGPDFARSLGQGVTLGHVDELAGLVSKILGKDYTQGRDAMRTQDQEAKAANPKMSAAVEMLSGAIPGLAASMIPGLAPVEGAHLLNAAKAATQGALVGGTAGEGASTASGVGGMARDAAMTAIPSAVLGGVAGGAVSKLAAPRGLPTGSAGRVTTEGAGLLPNMTPDEIAHIVSRQETLAPGTVVAADLSPELQTLARGVGADLKTSIKARAEAFDRYNGVKKGLGVLSDSYNALLKGKTAPVDPELTLAIAGTGKKGVLPPKATQADLLVIQNLRSNILAKARLTNDPSTAYELRQQAQPLTNWLQRVTPSIKGLDSDYAFLSQRAAVAKSTMKTLDKSAAAYGDSRAFGVQPGSVGASLPGAPLPGGTVGTVVTTATKTLSGSDRAKAAQAVYNQFLTPTRTSETLAKVLKIHGALTQPADYPMLNAARAAVFGGAIPAGLAQIVPQQQ